MNKILLGILIFFIVLFIYLHITFHLKTSDELEIYDIDETSKEKIEEIFDLRQPVSFYFNNKKLIDLTNKKSITTTFGSHNIKIRNISELDEESDDLYVPLTIDIATKLFNEDKTSCYFTEKNHEFLKENGISKHIKSYDAFLRPPMTSNCYYDVLFGSAGVFTPLRYEINYRNFFIVTQGQVQVKIAPPHNKKHLYVKYDYENFEFSSHINPWSPQPKYAPDFNKVKFLEFTLTPGKTLFLPANWWYSFKFANCDTNVTSLSYRTYMNNVAILPYTCLHLLQLHNFRKTINDDTNDADNDNITNAQFSDVTAKNNNDDNETAHTNNESENNNETELNNEIETNNNTELNKILR